MNDTLTPKIVTVLRGGYTLKDFSKDLTAGLVVGILSLPMSIAFAIASGARPEQGLYTAIVAGFLAGLLSGTRVQISGPAGAFVILVGDIIAHYGYDGMLVATILAGIILVVMGFTRLGAAIKFIPYPVVVGFTSGIALLIFSSQFKDFTGIHLTQPLPSHVGDKWMLYLSSLHQIDLPTLSVAMLSLGLMIVLTRVSKTIPAPLVVIVLATVAVQIFHLPIETIGTRYGAISTTFPLPSFPTVSLDRITELISPAIAIALLASIESLLSAVVADGMTGRRHRSDIELVAQGIGNIGSALFGGIPSTGAITRTVINVKAGGQTPVSSVIQSIVILLALLFLGSAVAMVPLATLSAILVIIAYHMSDWRRFLSLLRSSAGDVVILASTFLLTVLGDLITAIEVGIILAALLFMKRMADATRMEDFKVLVTEDEDPRDYDAIRQLEIPDGVEIYQIYGSLFFAAAEKFKVALSNIHRTPKALILRMRHVIDIDATGIRVLHDILDKAKHDKTIVILSGVSPQLYRALERGGITDLIGSEGFQKDIWASVAYAKIMLNNQT